jgi:hypothetical protein
LFFINYVALAKLGFQQFLFIAGKIIIEDADSNPENQRKEGSRGKRQAKVKPDAPKI